MEVDHFDEGLEGDFNKIDGRVRQLLGTLGRSNGLPLFGLTTAFLFAMAEICGMGRRRWFIFEV